MKKLVSVLVFFILASFSFAQKKSSLLADFHRGNINGKIETVKKASENFDISLLIQSLEFLCLADESLSEEDSFNQLAEITIRSFNSRNSSGFEKQITDGLCKLFRISESNRVKAAVIDSFYNVPCAESVHIVNNYFYKKMQNHSQMDDVTIKAIKFMGEKGNSASFNRLFIADILEIWPEYTDKIQESYGNLADENRKEILQMIVTVPAEKKVAILNKLRNNPKIPKKICGECAENVLSSIINIEEENSKDSKKDVVSLELICLEIIAESKWTRASSVTTSCFSRLRYEYEQGNITVEQFTKAIGNIASVAADDTVVVLSSYLDFLNKCTENNQPPVKDVVLSVINSLGDLGDNKAFDFIYAATSLDYPSEIVDAAKSAISKLKW